MKRCENRDNYLCTSLWHSCEALQKYYLWLMYLVLAVQHSSTEQLVHFWEPQTYVWDLLLKEFECLGLGCLEDRGDLWDYPNVIGQTGKRRGRKAAD